jgi:Mor family transcriptional regulator
VDIGDMARRFANGAMIKELAATYSISGSSVKRLLRAQGVRKRNC